MSPDPQQFIDQKLLFVPENLPPLASAPLSLSNPRQTSLPSNIMSSTYTCKHGSTEMLNPRNYHTWKADTMIFLRCENALDIVLGIEAPPAANASFAMRESYQRRLGRATGFIHPSNPIFEQSSISFPIKNQLASGQLLVRSTIRRHLDPADLRSVEGFNLQR